MKDTESTFWAMVTVWLLEFVVGTYVLAKGDVGLGFFAIGISMMWMFGCGYLAKEMNGDKS